MWTELTPFMSSPLMAPSYLTTIPGASSYWIDALFPEIENCDRNS